MEKPNRIPNLSFFVTWKYLDAGYKLSEAMTDYNKIESATILHQEKYNFDAIAEMGGRNLYNAILPLGIPGYIFDDEHDAVSVKEIEFISHEELKQFADNPKKFIWEVLMPRRYPAFFDDNDIDRFNDSYYEYTLFTSALARTSKRLKQDYGIPDMLNFGCPKNPVEWIVNWLRGIKGFCIDIRKDPVLMDAVMASFKEVFYDPTYLRIENMDNGKNPEVITDCGTSLLGHTLLNPKQWDRFYWPFIGKTLDLIIEKDKSCRLFVQGSCSRFWDYFQDITKGHLMLSLENDDLKETRKALPNICLNGGLPLSLLEYGTKEECVNHVKDIIDSLGGYEFVLTEDKMGTYRNDGRSENLKAVCDFVRNYTEF